jgi:putative ABC transport system permease protein
VIFQQADRAPWIFNVAAIYRPKKPTLDNRTLYFHWDYFAKTMEAADGEAPNVGVIVLEVAPGADAIAVMRSVDEMFENGPQVVQTTTEAEFQRQFVSMLGNVPQLVFFIGVGVFAAILLACINTMLMAAREQVRDVGILKALGFTDRAVAGLMIGQAMVLCGIGGGAGILFARMTEVGLGAALGSNLPGYAIQPGTYGIAVFITLACGVLAGIVPARNAGALRPVEALRRS